MLNGNRTLLAFELNRKMRDAEVGLDALLDVAQHIGGFAQTPVVEQHVRGERVGTAGDRPDVQVVHADDAGNSSNVLLRDDPG